MQVPGTINPNRDEFLRECERVWPMSWIPPPKAARAPPGFVSPLEIEAAALGTAMGAMGDEGDADGNGSGASALTPALRAYFEHGMQLAVAQAREGQGRGFGPTRGCVILQPKAQMQSATAATGNSASSNITTLYTVRGAGFDQQYRVARQAKAEGESSTTPAPASAAATTAIATTAIATAPQCFALSPPFLTEADYDKIQPHPLHTAVLLAIEAASVADRIAAGVAVPRRPDGPSERQTAVHSSDSYNAAEGNSPTSPQGPPPAKRARLSDEAETASSLVVAPSSSAAAAAVAPFAPYLCTGCDAFLTHEPDVFEAAALLHSRIARVIYGIPDEHYGALAGAASSGSSALRPSMHLHQMRSLNHRYLAFRVHSIVEHALGEDER